MRLYYEEFVSKINYDALGDWQIPNISSFSNNIKELFPYQVEALKNIIKLLNYFYTNECDKNKLYTKCLELGMSKNEFNVNEYIGKKNNALFDILKKYYKTIEEDNQKFIPGYERMNRANFWMATGSGKTILIIKLIEIIHYLQSIGKLPKNDIMVLFPDENIEKQFKKEVKKYNYFKFKQINIHSLKDYDDVKKYPTILDEIHVFSYRSDLLSTEEKNKKVNINAYDNNGKWFVFLDEAHKGDKSGESKRQNYITQWTRKGFLFNFSATSTDPLDYATTVYNYNLEKFISDGYGKNIYVSDSYFTFNKKDELNESQKQKQVLKSLINCTLIKKNKSEDYYHNPLIVTLVDTVNDNDSDLYMFFKEIEKIAVGNIEKKSFEEAKKELQEELISGRKYTLGSERLKKSYYSSITNITIEDILKHIYNSNTHGKIEIKIGEASKEIAMQLETANNPFLLIKIGDANKFKREKLSNNYQIGKSYSNKHFFDTLNSKDSHINILLGSRAFYEGWDSNRPNIINFINIGSSDAKKFVLQSIGRGVRIQPIQSNITYRKRAKNNESYKDELFETLFIYATNKTAINSILTTLDEQKVEKETIIEHINKNKTNFDLIVPSYKINSDKHSKAKFLISKATLEKCYNLFSVYSKELFMILFNLTNDDYNYLQQSFINNNIFRIDDNYNYKNTKDTLIKIVGHIKNKEYIVNNIRQINDNDINHFKWIKSTMNEKEVYNFEQRIKEIANNSNKNLSLEELKEKLEQKEINIDEYTKLLLENNNTQNSNRAIYNSEVILLNIKNHYYSPIIMTISDQIDYLKHAITVDSERIFIENLNNYIKQNIINSKWHFSKIDQTLDNIYIWYFNSKSNKYDKFYPDFIFWIKEDSKYKIYYVDPKGLQNVDYQFKISGFMDLFESDGQPKIFEYNKKTESFKVEFHLLLVGDTTIVPEQYKKYCIEQNDFSWLK